MKKIKGAEEEVVRTEVVSVIDEIIFYPKPKLFFLF